MPISCAHHVAVLAHTILGCKPIISPRGLAMNGPLALGCLQRLGANAELTVQMVPIARPIYQMVE